MLGDSAWVLCLGGSLQGALCWGHSRGPGGGNCAALFPAQLSPGMEGAFPWCFPAFLQGP